MADVDDLIAEHLVPDAEVSRPENWLYKVLLAVADRGSLGATDHELIEILQPPGGGNNVRPRRGDLESRGLLADSGTKRPTGTGRMATVWTLGEKVRSSLSPRLTQRDCALAALAAEDGSTPLNRTERDALAALRARLGLLARRAIRAAADAGAPVSVRVNDGPVEFRATRTGADSDRVSVVVALSGAGLEMSLRVQAAHESTDDVGDQRYQRFRIELARLAEQERAPLDALDSADWIYELRHDDAAEQVATATEWLSALGGNAALEGVLRRRITPQEVERLGEEIVEPVEKVVIAAMQAIDDATKKIRDPIQTLVNALLWSEERAKALLDLAERSKQLLFTGPPGTGKTLTARALATALADPARIRLVQFHPTYAYEDFVEGIRPVINKATSTLTYQIRKGVFKDFVNEARDAPAGAQFFLIVDEINRANLPKVLGELLFALEYRGPENEVELPYSGDKLYVPDNLWLIGTMNTADRSVALMDAAMRRRFKEFRFDVDLDALRRWHEQNTSADLGKEAASRLARINAEVVELLDDDRAIGHAYLMRTDLATVGFETVWREDLEPVLRDHLLGRTDDLPGLREAFLGDL